MEVATLNTWGTSGPYEARLGILSEAFRWMRPAILCLQEVVEARPLEILAEATGATLVAHHEASGLAILSRYPVLTRRRVDYAIQPLAEAHHRAALVATFETARGDVRVGCTHLSWRPADRETRLNQARQLLEALEEESDLPTLVAGDLNDVPTSRALIHLRERGFRDCFAEAHPGEEGWTWEANNPFTAAQQPQLPDRRIDYVLANARAWETWTLLDCQRILDTPSAEGIFASDHYGVLATFE